MKRIAYFLYGAVAYTAFLGTILYMIGFLGDFLVPKSVNDGPATPVMTAIAINLVLVLAFGVQHSVMARPSFKQWWTQYMPKPVERSTFVLVSSLILAATFWQWRPIDGSLWALEGTAPVVIAYSLFGFGWFLVFYSTFLINHFDLFGLRQVFLYLRNREYTHVPLKVVSLYRFIRNPLMLGFLIAMWATPVMTYSHLMFAAAMTGYIAVGVYFEERTLSRELGPTYRAYRERTPMLVPSLRGRASERIVESEPPAEGERTWS